MNRDRRIHQSGSSSFNHLFPRTSDAMSKNNYYDLGSMYNRRQDDRDASYSRFLRKPTYLFLYNPKVTIMMTKALMKYFYFSKLIEII